MSKSGSQLAWLDLAISPSQEVSEPILKYTFHDKNSMRISTLENLGNSCFFNSVIQALAKTTPLVQYVFRNTKRGDQLWQHFCQLIDAMYEDDYRISPDNMFSSFRIAFKKNNYQQEDAHEVLLFLLDKFDGVLKRSNVRYDDVYRNHHLVKKSLVAINQANPGVSIISETFMGQLHQRIQCSACKTISHTFPTFMDLVLRLENLTVYQSIYDLLLRFCRKETLEGDSGYNCDQCGEKKVMAYKKTTLWRVPECLIVVLGRFDWRGNKNSRKIDYPIEDLDLSKLSTFPVKRRLTYDLYSVICHIGNTHGGHYYNISQINGEWIKLNDESASRVIRQDDLVSTNAYILFYRKT